MSRNNNEENRNKKIIIAISGGVDSGMAAYLLRKKGYEVIGVFFRLSDNFNTSESAARAICRFLGIKFYPVNLSSKFNKEIIKYFVESYKNGLTPNPCVKCNQFIKFGELLRIMKELKADFVSTGHYIKKFERKKNGKIIYSLMQGKDKEKDQTYFLYNLTQAQLKYILFPLGEYLKNNIKKQAEKIELPNIKQESQDICFLNIGGEIVEHNNFLKKYIQAKPGWIKTLDGKKIGEHQGLPFYTIGQRKGIEIGGKGPYYVAKLDYESNTLFVTRDVNDKILYRDSLVAEKVNWIFGVKPNKDFKCEAVIRYKHKPVECIVNTNKNKSSYSVEFKEPQRAIAAGQSVVFYKDGELLGGGIIK